MFRVWHVCREMHFIFAGLSGLRSRVSTVERRRSGGVYDALHTRRENGSYFVEMRMNENSIFYLPTQVNAEPFTAGLRFTFDD